MQLLHLFVSPSHNYFGHHGQPAGAHPMEEVPELLCFANRGIRGDRFFDHKENYQGQITFFADEVYQSLCDDFAVRDKLFFVFR